MATIFLTSANTYDVKAIMVSAWANARAAVKKNQGNRAHCRGRGINIPLSTLTLREALRDTLAKAWSQAKAQRANAEFLAQRDARNTELALLPIKERALAELAQARVEAQHIDNTAEMISTVEAIDARISTLRSTA